MPTNKQDEQNQQNKETGVSVITNPEKTTLYIDNIHITGNDGAVIFDFLQYLPGKIKYNQGEDLRQAAVVTRIAITTQHYRRFIEACGKVLSEIDSHEHKAEEEK